MKVLPWNRHDRYINTGVKDEYGKPILISPAEVDGYLNDPEFRHYLNLWNITELVKRPPFGDGWTTWPYDVLTAFLAFYGENANLARERENKNAPQDDPSGLLGIKGKRHGRKA